MAIAERPARTAATTDGEFAGRPSGTVWLWAAIGGLGVVYMAWVWIPWLVSGNAHQPSAGRDHYGYLGVLRATEVLSTGVFFGLGYWSLVRPLIRGRGLTLDGKLFIGGTVASALDIFYAFMNPTWAMNAHAISLGTWSTHIPLFSNPGQNQSSWGLLWCLPAYIWLGLGAALSYTWLRDGRDRNDRCAVDRDVDRLAYGARVRTLLSVLAVTGYAAVTTLVAYQIPWDWLSMTAGARSFPLLPSYLVPGEDCGQPGTPLCASEFLERLRDGTVPATDIVARVAPFTRSRHSERHNDRIGH